MKKFIALLTVSLVALTGCQNVKSVFGKRNNGSLDYRNTQKLDPVRLPQGQQSAVFVPLYDTPNVTADQVAPFTNESGRQYKLPNPPKITE